MVSDFLDYQASNRLQLIGKTHFQSTLFTGYSKKDARFSKMKNMPDLLTDDRKGIYSKISTLNMLAIGRLLWETLYVSIAFKPK